MKQHKEIAKEGTKALHMCNRRSPSLKYLLFVQILMERRETKTRKMELIMQMETSHVKCNFAWSTHKKL